jgi:hypothetical protein
VREDVENIKGKKGARGVKIIAPSRVRKVSSKVSSKVSLKNSGYTTEKYNFA